MPNQLVECIPNFSEARRPEVVESILQAIKNVEAVHVLDQHSDLDHNRTVITFVGPPDAVEEAAFQAISKAGQLIDLNYHNGEHPRIGATDVVPFVPLEDVSMAECIEIARRLGKRVGNELNIPVYLYEEAATRPDHQNLENIRRGQYEGLKREIETNPDRQPDYGPNRLGPAGATVIGARQPLIAFNVYLNSDDVSIAQKIARAVRNSSGGFHFMKSLGVLVEGRAQVSMNFTNYRQTPLARVVETIRREAGRYGTTVHHSELVGLTPQDALTDSAVWYLQLDGFQPNLVLERRLYQLLLTKMEGPALNEQSFLDRLASGTPTPGGGSAGAIAGATAAALAAMVARVTVGKKKYAAVESQMWPIIDRAETLRAQLSAAAVEDSAAFEDLLSASKLPKDSQEQIAVRNSAVEEATLHAIEVPLRVAQQVVEVFELLISVAAVGNVNAISDAGSGIALARAALTCAGLNIKTNLAGLKDQTSAQPFLLELGRLEGKAADVEAQFAIILKERSNLSIGS
ncbi:MAG: glutamate formimidoyltransferase [Anaerolineaceae bacterium]|nr:glutamate formimidoyltransferase [Anaerolineaceae bacterium]